MRGLRLGRCSRVPFLVLAMLLCAASPAGAAILDAPWTGAGDGTTTVVSDGSAGDPRLDYELLGDGNVVGFSGAWSFSTVAGSARSVPVAWELSGFHSFFQVRAGLTWFVQRNGSDIAGATLLDAGPTDCCDPPSNGFDYSGSTTFPSLEPGDVYGFRVTGANGDENQTLQGSLILREVDGTAPVITPKVSGKTGGGGFYTGPVSVKWTVTDDGSRITSTNGCQDATVANDTAGLKFTCTAKSAGGTAAKSVTVKKDTAAPELSVPTVIVQTGTGPAGANVGFSATATDAIDRRPSVGCAPPPGSLFPVGTTTVSCTASDAAGNRTSKSFPTIVLPPPAITTVQTTTTGTPKPRRSRAVLLYRYLFVKGGTRLPQFKLRNLRSGTSVTVTCKGRGCPKALKRGGVALQNKRSTLNLARLVRKPFKNKSTLYVEITEPGSLVTIKRLVVRTRKAPKLTTTCLQPGASKPTSC